jgi:hypothetical protein
VDAPWGIRLELRLVAHMSEAHERTTTSPVLRSGSPGARRRSPPRVTTRCSSSSGKLVAPSVVVFPGSRDGPVRRYPSGDTERHPPIRPSPLAVRR